MTVVWARHPVSSTWCAIDRVTSCSVTTYCNGSWNASDNEDTEFAGGPPAHERCGACERELCARSPVTCGLAELVGSTETRIVEIDDLDDEALLARHLETGGESEP